MGCYSFIIKDVVSADIGRQKDSVSDLTSNQTFSWAGFVTFSVDLLCSSSTLF